ncbi:sugar ABC transporter permease [Candidatus Nomurabacteria bacterium]|nr:sugar ABC transporter permease [Candidatus Nomurabacteria bacterium]
MRARKNKGLTTKNALAGYLFSLPFIIGFIGFFLFPVLQSVLLSFRTVTANESGLSLEYVGWANYHKLLFVDPSFLKLDLARAMTTLSVNFPSILLFSFFIAVLLNQKFRGRGFARMMFFLPVIISSGVIILIQNNQVQQVTLNTINASASSAETGVAQLTDTVMRLIKSIKLNSGIIDFVSGAVSRIYEITISSGVQILIFLAGLQTISPSLYEASKIEGASGWENFWKITFPIISPLILVNAVYTIVDSMSGLSNGLVYRIYSTAFVYAEYGYSAAMGWVYFVIIILILSVFLAFASKLVYYEND